jgi:hypothetical protein
MFIRHWMSDVQLPIPDVQHPIFLGSSDWLWIRLLKSIKPEIKENLQLRHVSWNSVCITAYWWMEFMKSLVMCRMNGSLAGPESATDRRKQAWSTAFKTWAQSMGFRLCPGVRDSGRLSMSSSCTANSEVHSSCWLFFERKLLSCWATLTIIICYQRFHVTYFFLSQGTKDGQEEVPLNLAVRPKRMLAPTCFSPKAVSIYPGNDCILFEVHWPSFSWFFFW